MSISSTSLRISGLVSGMDTESMIKKLMDANRLPLDKLNQKKQLLEWQRDDYRSMNNMILDLKNSAFNMKLQSNYTAKQVSSSNESIISASATANATAGVYQLEVKQLANGGMLTSNAALGSTSGEDTKLQDLRSTAPTGDTLLRISGEKGTSTIVVKNTDTISSFVKNVNSQSAYTGVKVSYDKTMDRMFFTSVNTGASAKVELSATDLGTGDSDSAFLSEALGLTVNSTSLPGETVTGSVNFMTTPALQPDLSKKIDSTLATPQTFRITYKGTNYDVSIDNSTTVNTLLLNINSSMKSAGITAGLDSDGKISFTGIASGQSISFADQTADSVDIVASLGLTAGSNAGPDVKGSVAFVQQPPDFVDRTKKIDASMTGTEAFKIKYGTEEFTFNVNSTTSIGSLLDSINTSALGKKGVTAQLDPTTGKLVLTSPDNSKQLAFDDADQNAATGVLSKLGLAQGNVSGVDFTYAQTSGVGQDAIVKFNNAEGHYASNSMTIAGIAFVAKSEAVGTKVTVTVTQDTDAVYNKIKEFVDKYNTLVDAVSAKIKEKKDSDYAPLTDAQKEAMDDTQVTNWEARAKQGTLYNDSILKNGLYQFRHALSDSISGLAAGQKKSLWEIGISNANISNGTVTGDFSDNGKLYIDETKLRAAIAEDPDGVAALFSADDGDSKSAAGDGVATRLYNSASALFTQITDKAGVKDSVYSTYDLGKTEKTIEDQIIAWKDRLEDMEDRYYKQFSMMESYLNQMSAQSSWLTQQTSS